jgi:hypothetical protein
MKITTTDLAMQSKHVAMVRQESNETLRAWRGERPDFAAEQPARAAQAVQSALVNISDTARSLFANNRPAVPPAPTFDSDAGQAQAIESASEAADNDPFLSLVKRMVEMLTGEQVRVFDMEAFSAKMQHVEARAAASSEQLQTAAAGRAGWGMEFSAYNLREEFEHTRFAAAGVVRTADGQEISFQLDLEMTRYYREESSVSIRAGDAIRKDPLVVNFAGNAAQLAAHAGQKFRFDLDGDGQLENLPLFASGSGYLALDLDHNARIDSGKELFGPQTGNGFQELAQWDDDGNGWIDENDAVFEQLQVWTPTAEGPGTLQSLAQLGIGALALAHVSTPFSLRGEGNSDLGVIKAGGLFLRENGLPGTLQEIDLTV